MPKNHKINSKIEYSIFAQSQRKVIEKELEQLGTNRATYNTPP